MFLWTLNDPHYPKTNAPLHVTEQQQQQPKSWDCY